MYISYDLKRTGIGSIDNALYCAGCFAASAADGSRTVTILCTFRGNGRHPSEEYRVDDGVVAGYQEADTKWTPVYVLTDPRQGR